MAEIYGEPFVETARDKLVALLNSLKTTMASGYDPTFSYVYEHHNVANLRLNAVSVELINLTLTDKESYQTQTHTEVLMTFGIRVHTAYGGGISDGQKQSRLLCSIMNKLRKNYHLGDNYTLVDALDFAVDQEFESDTIGGELHANIRVVVGFIQE